MIFDAIIFKNKLNLFLSTILVSVTLGTVRKISKLFSYKNSVVCVIALHKLGDSVFTIPAISLIKKHFINDITVVCFNESVPIFNIKFDNIKYLILDRNDFYFRKRIANRKAKKKLKILNPEIIIDLTGELTSTSLIYSSRASQIIGLTKKHFSPVYDKFVNIEYTHHITEQYLNVLSLINPTIATNIHLIEEFKLFPIKTIYIHPFAGWKAKEWSLNKFILLALSLKKLYNVKIIIPSSFIFEEIIDEIKSLGIEIIFTQNIEDLIFVIKECSLLICNDSGPIQIASLLGKYTFSIYGPTNPAVHKPKGIQHGHYLKEITCSPQMYEKMCFTAGGRIGCPSNECLQMIGVNEILKNLDIFINKFHSKIYVQKST